MNASAGEGAHFRDVFAPQVPARARALLSADDDADQSLSLVYWAAGSCALLVVLGIGLVRRAEAGTPAVVAGWAFLAAVPIMLLTVGAVAIGTRRRDRRLRARYRESHLDATALAAAAARFPGVGSRFSRLRDVLAELAASRAHRDGWLPGGDARALATIEWELTRRLVETLPVRELLQEAAGRGRLADQVAVRVDQIASVEADVDAQLDQLTETAAAAARIDELLGDLRLAERLAAEGPTEAEIRLRRALPVATVADADHVAAGAIAVEDLLRAQLGALVMPPRPEPHTSE